MAFSFIVDGDLEKSLKRIAEELDKEADSIIKAMLVDSLERYKYDFSYNKHLRRVLSR